MKEQEWIMGQLAQLIEQATLEDLRVLLIFARGIIK